MPRMWLCGAGVALVVAITLAGVAHGGPPMIKQAKDAGFPAQNCQYCHTEKLPKKETFKPEDLNERGKWLSAEKTKRNAPKVDAGWLKDYPGPKE